MQIPLILLCHLLCPTGTKAQASSSTESVAASSVVGRQDHWHRLLPALMCHRSTRSSSGETSLGPFRTSLSERWSGSPKSASAHRPPTKPRTARWVSDQSNIKRREREETEHWLATACSELVHLGGVWGPRRRWETPYFNVPTSQRRKNIVTDGNVIKQSKVDVTNYGCYEIYHSLICSKIIVFIEIEN